MISRQAPTTHAMCVSATRPTTPAVSCAASPPVSGSLTSTRCQRATVTWPRQQTSGTGWRTRVRARKSAKATTGKAVDKVKSTFAARFSSRKKSTWPGHSQRKTFPSFRLCQRERKRRAVYLNIYQLSRPVLPVMLAPSEVQEVLTVFRFNEIYHFQSSSLRST
jgi:hypothetical protein